MQTHQMEARRGKGSSNRGSAASRAAAVGKENICPALSSREALSSSRSPLPEGFPRVPLQDITHILSPINILPNDDDGDATELGLCRRGHKRPKCVAETQTRSCIIRSECELISSEKEWRGLRKCVTLQAGSSDMPVKGKSKLMEDVERQNLANVTENTELKDEAKRTDTVKIEDESLLHRETRGTEQMLAVGVLKTEFVEASCPVRSLRSKPRRPLSVVSSSSPAIRASLCSMQEKPKMSSIMKFR